MPACTLSYQMQTLRGTFVPVIHAVTTRLRNSVVLNQHSGRENNYHHGESLRCGCAKRLYACAGHAIWKRPGGLPQSHPDRL